MTHLARIFLTEYCIYFTIESTVLGLVSWLSVVVNTPVVRALQPGEDVLPEGRGCGDMGYNRDMVIRVIRGHGFRGVTTGTWVITGTWFGGVTTGTWFRGVTTVTWVPGDMGYNGDMVSGGYNRERGTGGYNRNIGFGGGLQRGQGFQGLTTGSVGF